MSDHQSIQHDPKPPRWLDRLMAYCCPEHLREEVMGDLHERFYYMVENNGPKRANRRYFLEILIYLKATAFRRQGSKYSTPNFITMLKHYFITAFRNTIRNKAFSTINILGLAFGMTCFLLISLWVTDEKQVDNFHQNGDQLYALFLTSKVNGMTSGDYEISEWIYYHQNDQENHWLAEELKEAIPEIQYASSYATSYELPWGYPSTFQVDDVKHRIKGATAGGDFFRMFSYPVLFGDASNALDELNSISISERMAAMFFEKPSDAIGQTIRFENKIDLVVKAVFKNINSKSSLQFDYLVSWENNKRHHVPLSDNKWPTYIQLKDNVDPEVVAEKIRLFNNGFKNPNYEELYLGMQHFGDQYLRSEFINGKPQNGRIEYVNIFSGVAIFILIIACVNFMNLATARSLKRAKEVGVRKVVGSSRGYIIGQFLGEALLLSFVALGISLILVRLLLPAFNAFTGKAMEIPLSDPIFWLFLMALATLVGFLSGSYPALFLSSLKPVKVLKGLMRFSRSATWFRKGLTVFQFSLSILLLIATLVVSRQTDYIQNAHLGYDKENIIYVRIEGDLIDEYHVFKERLLTLPGIAMVDRSSEAPHDMDFEIAGPFKWEGMEEGTALSFKPTSVGFDFLEMMDLQIVDGRGFSRNYPTDTAAFMVNETALKKMNLENPLGKRISAWNKQGHIIGILKDYHTHSLHEPIKPLIVDVKEDLDFGIIMVKTGPGKTVEALESLEIAHNEINPEYPLEYQFLDQEYAALYNSEQVISSLSNVFALLAIVISSLGLLGLAMFSAEQRIKEIGIRKVLGASVQSIISLFSKDFLKLVGLSFIIATPIAAYLMKSWLQGFAYKISLSWWIFALTGLSALAIALLTVGYQTIKAAKMNPIQNLRTE